jgi:hypothetical protein
MAAGDLVRVEGDPWVKEKVTLKTTTGCTKGQVLAYDTDGYSAATIAIRCAAPTYPFRVALQTVTAPTAGQSECEVLTRGGVEVNKVSGVLGPVIGKHQKVWISTTAGKVGPMCAFSTAYKTDWALEAGEGLAAAAAAATTVKIRLTGH